MLLARDVAAAHRQLLTIITKPFSIPFLAANKAGLMTLASLSSACLAWPVTSQAQAGVHDRLPVASCA
ncbi:hypothetical protein WJX74_007316 [Apatococcus lobatus]|uniref:Uncharacterized protein n=1 Tax=Apatococcus lobatus TaxID=904363 RepID=A0AAW1RHD8_9CHLO